ncbi:MAG: nucleotidyltransferase domain-containing protein [Planctomycetota bacterium]
MVQTRQEVFDLVRELRDGLHELYGERLKGVYLYGSYARGEGDADSDIDVAVVLSGPVDRARERLRSAALADALSLREDCLLTLFFLSEAQLRDQPYEIHRSIAREGLPI